MGLGPAGFQDKVKYFLFCFFYQGLCFPAAELIFYLCRLTSHSCYDDVRKCGVLGRSVPVLLASRE